MTKINKGATLVGRIQWNNKTANVIELWMDYNRNTGEPILWQRNSAYTMAYRFTGRRLRQLVVELDEALNENDVRWMEEPNHACLDALKEQHS